MDTTEIMFYLKKIDSDVSELKVRVTAIEERMDKFEKNIGGRMDKLEQRMDRLEERMDRLEEKVDKLDVRMTSLETNFKIYKLQESIIQEGVNTEYIYKLLRSNLTTEYIIKIKTPFDFYPPKGNRITDIDGCILLNPTIKGAKLIDDRLPGFILKDNSHKISTKLLKQITIIIESKHSLNKYKIDNKFRNMIDIENVLKSYDTIDITTTQKGFKKMISNIDISKFPKTVNIIFASEDLKSELNDFLKEIYEGTLTENVYNRCTLNSLLEDDFYKALIADNTIQKDIIDELKTLLEDAFSDEDISNNLETIRNNCKISKYGYRSNYLNKYIIPFTDIYESLYKHVIGKFGIFQYNNLYMPHILSEYSNAYLTTTGGSYMSHKRTLRKKIL